METDKMIVKEDLQHSAIIPVPTPEPSTLNWWMPKQEAVKQRLLQGNVDLLFLGNSIVDDFDEAGKEYWERYYAPRNSVNMGFSGDSTQHLLWRINDCNFGNISPKLSIIMIGTNNIGHNTNAEIVDGIQAVVNKMHVSFSKMKILLLGIFPRYEVDNPDRKSILEINKKSSEIADGKTIHYLDIGNVFLSENNSISLEIMHDLLHPTKAGYKLFAEAIESKLAELMGE